MSLEKMVSEGCLKNDNFKEGSPYQKYQSLETAQLIHIEG